MKEIVCPGTVVFCDTDCGGVVSNIAYLRFVERARCELFEGLGLSLSGMEESGLFPTVVRTEIDYRIPARLGDRLEVRATLSDVGRLRMRCSFEISRESAPESGRRERLVEAEQTVVLLQLPQGRPRPTPEEWRT